MRRHLVLRTGCAAASRFAYLREMTAKFPQLLLQLLQFAVLASHDVIESVMQLVLERGLVLEFLDAPA